MGYGFDKMSLYIVKLEKFCLKTINIENPQSISEERLETHTWKKERKRSKIADVRMDQKTKAFSQFSHVYKPIQKGY